MLLDFIRAELEQVSKRLQGLLQYLSINQQYWDIKRTEVDFLKGQIERFEKAIEDQD
jgi:phage terminase Nu1 subunit (DNA packaging protein)